MPSPNSVDELLFAPEILTVSSLPIIERLMVGDPMALFPGRSLVAQMDLLGLNGEQDCPEVIAFTSKSALPVGDVLRGIYEAHGTEPPLLIAVSGPASKLRHSEDDNRNLSHYPATLAEHARLKRLVDGRARGIVVDQYICSGNTLEGARLLLADVGIEYCHTIKGDWYEDASEEQVPDVEQPTSVFAARMHQIGHRCYAAYQDRKPNTQVA